MAGHHDPKLLYAIKGIKAYHIQDGQEQELTPSGPQTLSLLMVPTSSAFADLSTTVPQNEIADKDFYLHLNLPPELDLPLPATTQVYHQPPHSYLIPRWDLGHSSGAFTRIEFPRIGAGVTQDDVDTFETILAQCTAFLERAKPPMPSRPGEKSTYNPSDYAAGGKFAMDEKTGRQHGEIVLVDEDNGSVVGELGDATQVVESASLKPGSKDPVEIQVSADGKRIEVRPISEDYLHLANLPAYKNSSIVQNAATASRLLVTTSSYIGDMLTNQADNFTRSTKPNAKPMEFAPTTHQRVRKINTFTQGAASMSSKTVGQLSHTVQNMAAKASGKKKERPNRGYNEQGSPLDENDYKPGMLNKSLIAFSTVMDGIATSGKTLLTTGGGAASTVVGHRWGDQAGQLAGDLAGGVMNVGLVYIDVTGVSRRAVITSVAKGMIIGKVRGGGQVVVGGGDGGVIPNEDIKAAQGYQGVEDNKGGFQPASDAYQPEGYGSGAPPKYQEFGQPGNSHPREKFQ